MEENLLTVTNNPVSTPELSEEEEWDTETSELTGTLNKWTNYIHGWQKRYMAIKVAIDIEIDIECLLTHVPSYGVLVLPDEIMDIMKKAIPIH